MRDVASAGVLSRRYQDQNADSAGRGLPRRVGLLGEDREVCRFGVGKQLYGVDQSVPTYTFRCCSAAHTHLIQL